MKMKLGNNYSNNKDDVATFFTDHFSFNFCVSRFTDNNSSGI
jgi:hypothetical protein